MWKKYGTNCRRKLSWNFISCTWGNFTGDYYGYDWFSKRWGIKHGDFDFDFDDDNLAKVIETPVAEEHEEESNTALESCPTGAIEEE